jgi:hypothetical protein
MSLTPSSLSNDRHHQGPRRSHESRPGFSTGAAFTCLSTNLAYVSAVGHTVATTVTAAFSGRSMQMSQTSCAAVPAVSTFAVVRSALSRRGQKRPLASPPSRRAQPAPTDQPRPGLQRHRLGAGLTRGPPHRGELNRDRQAHPRHPHGHSQAPHASLRPRHANVAQTAYRNTIVQDTPSRRRDPKRVRRPLPGPQARRAAHQMALLDSER